MGANRQQDSATPADFVMAEGEGWKLGYDRSPASASSYSALIGSEGFSFAITRQEYDDFIKVCPGMRPHNIHMAYPRAAYIRMYAPLRRHEAYRVSMYAASRHCSQQHHSCRKDSRDSMFRCLSHHRPHIKRVVLHA